MASTAATARSNIEISELLNPEGAGAFVFEPFEPVPEPVCVLAGGPVVVFDDGCSVGPAVALAAGPGAIKSIMPAEPHSDGRLRLATLPR